MSRHRLLMAALGLDGFATKYGGGHRDYGQCFGCGKPAKNRHCLKCQEKDPFAWQFVDAGGGVMYGRYKGEVVKVQQGHRGWTGYYDFEEVVGTSHSMDRCRELLEKYLLRADAARNSV